MARVEAKGARPLERAGLEVHLLREHPEARPEAQRDVVDGQVADAMDSPDGALDELRTRATSRARISFAAAALAGRGQRAWWE